MQRTQDARLRHMLALCARGHDYSRRRWTEAGVDVGTIRGVDDLERLPLTSKQDLMADPEAFRLRVPDLPLHERVLWEVIYTTGSTAEPTPVYNTTHDYHAYLFQSRRGGGVSRLHENGGVADRLPPPAAPA